MLPSLYSKLKNCGSKCLIEVISELPESLQNCEPQQTEGVTYGTIFKFKKILYSLFNFICINQSMQNTTLQSI